MFWAKLPNLRFPTYLCLKGETNWQYWQLYLSSLLNSAMAEWLLSWDLSPCMDMKTRSHWAHGWPPAANLCFKWSSDTTALAAATRAAAVPLTALVSGSSVCAATSPDTEETMGGPIIVATGLSRSSASAASTSTRSPLVRLSEGSVRGTSLNSCCKTQSRSLRCAVSFVSVGLVCKSLLKRRCMTLSLGQRLRATIYLDSQALILTQIGVHWCVT